MTKDLSQAMRDGMRRLASGVSVISTMGTDAKPYAMTATSVTSLTDSPASLLVCVNRSARMHDLLLPGHNMAVNLLSQGHEDVSVACSTGDQAESRFQTGKWLIQGGHAPYLQDAEAVFECVVAQCHAYGNHSIVIGDITRVRVSEAAPRPLIYHNGAYLKPR